MKNLITYTLAATLVAGATAQHQHRHHHGRRSGTRVVKRAPAVVTEYIVGATETIYELEGKKLSDEEAKAGIDGGNLVVIGESEPTYTTPAAAPTTSSKAEKASLGAQFYESESSSAEPTTSIAPTTSTTPVPEPSTSSTSEAAASSTQEVSVSSKSSSSSYSSGGTGVDKEFPSGEIKCSVFPSDYGAIPLEWMKLDGWSGIQYVPDYTPGDTSITTIDTAIAGDSCTKNAMCSYACPAGYQKTQWPDAQGSTKESIGGLYCNSDGYLELTREGYTTLCEQGAGGVTIKNELSVGVATCRTDYPGTENMVIPAWADAGSSISVCNPIQDSYYIWDGSGTSAQYYVNKKGYSNEEACVWTSSTDSDGAGNWAPIVLGVGQGADGNTYISIFQNLPTSTAKLDFNIEIKGGNTKCSYIDGSWTGGLAGCTTTISGSQKAVVRYF
ncbi:Sperm-associated antigen 4 protein [Neonectria punicea]|uniref:Sperm-associated antigen 4 protein n=1 Tax=Neonectria punicea TaxID=979145 RepID=A0ABR1H554_9HYPO